MCVVLGVRACDSVYNVVCVCASLCACALVGVRAFLSVCVRFLFGVVVLQDGGARDGGEARKRFVVAGGVASRNDEMVAAQRQGGAAARWRSSKVAQDGASA